MCLDDADEDADREDEEDGQQESRINHYFQNNVTIIGMGVFFIIGLVDDVANTIGGFQCYQTFNSCSDAGLMAYFIKHELPLIVFSIVRPLFLGTLFIFCIKFHGKRLKKCAKVRYSLVIVLLEVTAVWIHANLR